MQYIKKLVLLIFGRFPGAVSMMKGWVAEFRAVRDTSMYLRDSHLVWRHMNWKRERPLHVIEAELVFQYHKLEKGLSMPGPKRFFGAQPCLHTLALAKEWESAGGSKTGSIYVGAIETLSSYLIEAKARGTPQQLSEANLIEDLQSFLEGRQHSREERLSTPIALPPRGTEIDSKWFDDLMHARRSVRSFLPDGVPISEIESAIASAQLSPSACNRQPWRVHVYQDKATIKSLLSHQNGNSGFGHLLSTLLVITADLRSFFDGSERNEPYIDGGLFTMSLILGLHTRGISSCCLNWCVSPSTDKSAHSVAGIAESERIVMFLAVGYAQPEAVVPRSPRKDMAQVLIQH
jgi:nitroreductase